MNTVTHWTPIPGEPFLEASQDGKIRRLERTLAVAERNERGHSKGNFRKVQRGGVVLPWVNADGYLVIVYRIDGKKRKRYVHRLIAKTFVAGDFQGATVDHIDGDKANNRSDNLQWVTLAENTRRQAAAGRGPKRGEANSKSKLKDADLPMLFAMRDEGKSLSQIGAHFGVSVSLVHKITNGTRRMGQGQSPRR